MIAQLLIPKFSRVYVYTLHAMYRGFFPVQAGIFAAVILASAVWCSSARADDYDIIIEKNLFHDKRQKWEMEKSQAQGSSSQAGSQDRPSIDTIGLFGTVIKDSQSYAVMRVSEPAAKLKAARRSSRRASKNKGREINSAQAGSQSQDNNRPYAVGDFINGYQIVAIQSEKVLLQDPYDKKSYEIFMNEGQTERTEVRTEIPEDKPAKVSGKARKPSGRSKNQPPTSQSKNSSADALRKRFERNLKQMSKKKNDAVEQQAERDWQKLQPMMESLDEEGQEELNRLKNEFEKLRN